MSAIRSTLEVAEKSVRGSRQLISASPQDVVKPSHDEDMMYAWSIGVTKVGRVYSDPVDQEPAPRQEESCPPEVYIG